MLLLLLYVSVFILWLVLSALMSSNVAVHQLALYKYLRRRLRIQCCHGFVKFVSGTWHPAADAVLKRGVTHQGITSRRIRSFSTEYWLPKR